MKTKTKIKAGALTTNHNEKLVTKSLKTRTKIKAGLISSNHNEKLVRR